jgi:hypothetical protein
MASPNIDPDDFTRPGTRRIESLAAAARAPIVAGAGADGHVHVWNVETRTRICDFSTSKDSGGVAVAVTPDGRDCLVGTYYAWGVARVDVASHEKRWHRTDLRKVYGLSCSADGGEVIVWFDGRAGMCLDLQTGETRTKRSGLRMFAASRFDRTELNYRTRFELCEGGRVRHTWPRDSFALLACAFSPRLCVVAESGVAAKAIELTSGKLAWSCQSREGAHLIRIDFSPRLGCFVALEYAYTENGRATGPMVALLHIDGAGDVVFRQPVRAWSVGVFCVDADFLLNGLGELSETQSGTVRHVFDFPR